MNNKRKLVKWILSLAGVACIILVGILIFKSFNDINDRFVFAIDGYSLKKNEMTFGDSSDVYFNKVHKDFLSVKYDKNERVFTWEIKEDADTLYYFKINDENPNIYDISEGGTVKVECDGETREVVYDSIINIYRNLWNNRDFKIKNGQQYLPLSLVLKRLYGDDPVCEHYCGNSFFYCKPQGRFIKDMCGVQLCILDRYTTLYKQDGSACKYCYKGDVHLSDTVENAMKVQFFSLQGGHYKKENADDEILEYNGLNYTLKPVVITTEWGAGHVMLRPFADSIRVVFAKPLMYAESLDTLRAWSDCTAGQIVFRQNNKTYPRKNNIYFMPFTMALPAEICSLGFFDDSVKIKYLSGDSIMVVRNESFTPAQMKNLEIKTSGGKIDARAEILDGNIIWSFLKIPLCLFGIIALFIFFFTNYIPINQQWVNERGWRKWLKLLFKGSNNADSISDQTTWAWLYMILLMVLLFGYGCVKTMIGLKLAYTYPYFEKIENILPASISMSLVLFYFVVMLINAKLFFVPQNLEQNKKRGLIRMALVIVSGFILLIVAYIGALKPVDYGNGASVIKSYFHNDIWQMNPIGWSDNNALNDTHRTVVYMQYLVSILLFVIAVVYGFVLLFIDKENVKTRKCWILFGVALFLFGVGYLFWKFISVLIGLVIAFIGFVILLYIFEKIKNKKNGKIISDIFICVLGLLFIGAGFLGSNFATALITIGFVMVSSKIIEKGGMWKQIINMIAPIVLILGSVFCVVKSVYLVGIILFAIAALYLMYFVIRRKSYNWIELLPPIFLLASITILQIVVFGLSCISDYGYITYGLVIFTPIVFWWLWQFRNRDNEEDGDTNPKLRKIMKVVVFLCVGLLLGSVVYVTKHLSSGVDYGRTDRRLSLWLEYDTVKEKGYRYSENDAEFMSVMTKYMMLDTDTICADPLDGNVHLLHPSVSSGQSPVILNDLSAPGAFFSAYGSKAYWICILLVLAMIVTVMVYTFFVDGYAFLSVQMIWRVSALLMWISATAYLFSSYIGMVPFTGRLIPGFGVDSVGEALEFVFLFGFMASTALMFTNGRDDNHREDWCG